MNKTIKNITFYTVSTVLIQITSFILFPLLANKLEPANFGKFNFFNTIYLYLSAISILGYSNFLSRQCPRETNQIPLLISYLKLKVIFTLVVSFFYSLILIFNNIEDINIHLSLIIFLIFSIPDFRWFYIANEKLYIVSVINLVTQLLFFVVILILFYFNIVSFYLVFIIQSLINLIPVIYFLYLFLNQFKEEFDFTKSFIFDWNMILESFYFGSISIIANFNVYFGVIWVTSFLGFSSQGIYSVAYKFVLLVNLFFNLIGQVYTPLISKFYLNDHKSLRIHLKQYFFITVLMGTFSVLGIKYVLPLLFDHLFNSKYKDSMYLINYLSTTLVPLQILSIFLSNILMSTKFSKQVLISLALGTSYYFLTILFFSPTRNIDSILHLQVSMELIILIVLSLFFIISRKSILN